MTLREVRLENVRNRPSLALSLVEGVNVIAGANGVGKTSVLEGIHIGLRGWSPRTRSLRDVVSKGADYFRVELVLAEPDGRRSVAATGYDRSGERRVSRDGAPVEAYSRWEDEIPVRVFLPDHLLLIKGGPRRRRRYVDELTTTAHPGHRALAVEYEEALRQRNWLLRQGVAGAEHAAWERVLAQRGLEYARARAETLAAFSPRYARAYGELVGEATARARLVYRTNTAGLDEVAYQERLAEERGDDRRRGYTRLGPHRDDVRFYLQERDLREFGSQGEQRTGLLAAVLAERAWLLEERGVHPLLLLDDVMSELDRDRREALLETLESGGQSLITTTATEYFPSARLATMNLVRLEAPGAGEDPGTGVEET